MCPKGQDKSKQCDVHGDPPTERVSKWNPMTLKRINERRVDVGRPPLTVNAVSCSSTVPNLPPDPSYEMTREEYTAATMARLDALQCAAMGV